MERIITTNSADQPVFLPDTDPSFIRLRFLDKEFKVSKIKANELFIELDHLLHGEDLTKMNSCATLDE